MVFSVQMENICTMHSLMASILTNNFIQLSIFAEKLVFFFFNVFSIHSLREQEYKPIPGSSCMFEFSSYFSQHNTDAPVIWSRKFPCRCENCRSRLEEIHCSFLLGCGFSSSNDVHHKKTWTLDDTREKQATDKKDRKEKVQAKALQLVINRAATPMTIETATAVVQAVSQQQIQDANHVATQRDEGVGGLHYLEPEVIDEDLDEAEVEEEEHW